MSAADGTIDKREKEYLKIIANRLGIDGRFLTVLEASFSNQAISDTAALAEVHSLLDPAQFQSLDSLFVRAASHILEHLPEKPKQQKNQKHSVSSYQELQKFQEYRTQLETVYNQLHLTLVDGSDRNVLSPNLTEEVTKVSRKLESQCFRVAVVGEFSKGKSTLLNALLGEEIQPVRDIPCSGTVTVLKYGSQQRVICKYKDGREEEISPQQYKDKASISEEAALGSVGDAIVNSEIKEIIFEHPNLELCTNGVEIIDSPGLNEQAERTLVTEQVLKTTDAVIFLTHAQNALTEKERELLLYLKKELNPGKDDEGAKSIFVLVNFADLLRREESRKQVRQRVETIVKSQNLIAGENRIHFISAQSALDAILDGTENEYVESFQDFTKSLEQFLTEERGAITLQQSAAGIQQIIDTGCQELNQWQKMSEGKLTVSEGDKQKIFEKIGEVSGRDVKIKEIAKKLKAKSLKEILESWDIWREGLQERINLKSATWESEHSHIWSQDKLIQDYVNKFVLEITEEIDNWAEQRLQPILNRNRIVLQTQISENIDAIRQDFQQFDQQLNTSLINQFNSLVTARSFGVIGRIRGDISSSIDADIAGAGGYVGGLGISALVAAGLTFFTGFGIIPVMLAALAAGGGGAFGLGILDVDGLQAQIKKKVCELGFQKFGESAESIFETVQERVIAAFNDCTDANSDVMSKAISLWENLLEQEERRDHQNQAECEAEKVWLADKRRELEQVQSQIETILNQSDR
jgi:ribosome-binding ATPase YchF (GTP1/OBG family)